MAEKIQSAEEMLASLGVAIADPEEVQKFHPCQMTVRQVKELVGQSNLTDDEVKETAKTILTGIVGLADGITVVISREDVEKLGGTVTVKRNVHCIGDCGKKTKLRPTGNPDVKT